MIMMSTPHHDTRRCGNLEIFEDGVPPRFRLHSETGPSLAAHSTVIETMRQEGTRQEFSMTERGGCLESVEEILEPHSFVAQLRVDRTITGRSWRGSARCRTSPSKFARREAVRACGDLDELAPF